MQPLTLCAYEVDAQPIFDALSEATRQELGVTNSELACPTWEADRSAGRLPKSQALADRLVAAGYAGMRVQSFALGMGAHDQNLVMWKWSSDWPVRVVLVDDKGRLSGGRVH